MGRGKNRKKNKRKSPDMRMTDGLPATAVPIRITTEAARGAGVELQPIKTGEAAINWNKPLPVTITTEAAAGAGVSQRRIQEQRAERGLAPVQPWDKREAADGGPAATPVGEAHEGRMVKYGVERAVLPLIGTGTPEPQEIYRNVRRSPTTGVPVADKARVNIHDEAHRMLSDPMLREAAEKLIQDTTPETRADLETWRRVAARHNPDWSPQKVDTAIRIAHEVLKEHEAGKVTEPHVALNYTEIAKMVEAGHAYPKSTVAEDHAPIPIGGASRNPVTVDGAILPQRSKDNRYDVRREGPGDFKVTYEWSQPHKARMENDDRTEGHYRHDYAEGELWRAIMQIAQAEPALFAKFYPRIYENLGKYHSPKVAAAYLTTVVMEMVRLGADQVPTAYRLLTPALAQMAERRMPHFFIAPKLLEAVQMTDFHDDIDWTTMHLPYEQGTFILPQGAFQHEKDGDISLICWARYRANVRYPSPALFAPTTTLTHDCFSIIALAPRTGVWYDSVFNAENRKTVKMRNMFYRAPGEEAPKLVKQHYLDEDLNEQDSEFLEKLGVIAFGTLLAMNARPDLVTHGKLEKRVAKKDEPVKEFWSPNVVGERYRPRVVTVKPEGGATGTHASPRYHWRRGHYRNQRHGAGNREVKVIWIEPVQVGLHLISEGLHANEKQ